MANYLRHKDGSGYTGPTSVGFPAPVMRGVIMSVPAIASAQGLRVDVGHDSEEYDPEFRGHICLVVCRRDGAFGIELSPDEARALAKLLRQAAKAFEEAHD